MGRMFLSFVLSAVLLGCASHSTSVLKPMPEGSLTPTAVAKGIRDIIKDKVGQDRSFYAWNVSDKIIQASISTEDPIDSELADVTACSNYTKLNKSSQPPFFDCQV